MELLERLDKFRHRTEVFGLKSGECTIEGKEYVIVDFGLKEEEKILNNIKEISLLSEIRQGEGSLEALEQYNLIRAELYFGEFKRLFYLEGEELDQSEVLKFLEVEGLGCKGEILFSKKNAGYFVKVKGNLYFLPKRESLSHYRPGMIESGYLELLKNAGLYLENLIMVCQEENKLNISQIDKVELLGKFLERSLLLQYKYLSTRNKNKWRKLRGDFYRGRILFALSYYYNNIEPLIKQIQELRVVGDKELEKLIGFSLEKIREKREGRVEELEGLYERILKYIDESKTLKRVQKGLGMLEIVILMMKQEREIIEPIDFRIGRSEEIDFRFSKMVEVLGDERRMTSLTRKGI